MNRYNPDQYMDKEYLRFKKEVDALKSEIKKLEAQKPNLLQEIKLLEDRKNSLLKEVDLLGSVKKPVKAAPPVRAVPKKKK